MVHCNFIGDSFAGNGKQKVLKVLPYKDKSNDDGYIKMESAQYEFLPVILNENNLLQFELRNVFGHPIYFVDDANQTFLNLIFREKINKNK